DPAYYEKFYFTPGDLGFRAFDTRVGRIGTLVCWDQWYPEGARLTALQGANVLFYPTAIGWHPKEKATHGAQQLDAWRTIQRRHLPLAPTPRPPSASVCPPSGSRIPPRGWDGRITRATGPASWRRSPGCTARSCARSPRVKSPASW